MNSKKRNAYMRQLAAQVMNQDITMSESVWMLMVFDGKAVDVRDAMIQCGVRAAMN